MQRTFDSVPNADVSSTDWTGTERASRTRWKAAATSRCRHDLPMFESETDYAYYFVSICCGIGFMSKEVITVERKAG